MDGFKCVRNVCKKIEEERVPCIEDEDCKTRNCDKIMKLCIPKNTGSLCQNDVECYSNNCKAGLCQEKTCTKNSDCRTNICNNGKCSISFDDDDKKKNKKETFTSNKCNGNSQCSGLNKCKDGVCEEGRMVPDKVCRKRPYGVASVDDWACESGHSCAGFCVRPKESVDVGDKCDCAGDCENPARNTCDFWKCKIKMGVIDLGMGCEIDGQCKTGFLCKLAVKKSDADNCNDKETLDKHVGFSKEIHDDKEYT